MSVFEEVFTKRGGEEPAEDASVGAFDGVFARRGRWRKQPAAGARPGDSEELASEFPSAYTASTLLETAEPKLCKELETVMENPLEIHEVGQQEGKDKAAVALHEGSQFLVKNTFLTTEGLEYDSLKDFLQERNAFSCPVSMLNTETICKEDGDAAAAYGVSTLRDIVFKTSSTMADFIQEDSFKGVMAPRACSWNTASTFMDLQRLESIDEMVAEVDLAPPAPAVVLQPLAPCEPQAHCVAPHEQQQGCVDGRLNNLRMKGSAIQQQLSQAAPQEADRQTPKSTNELVTAVSFVQLQASPWMPPHSEVLAALPEQMPVIFRPDALPPPPPPAAVPPPPVGVAPTTPGILRLAEAIAPPELGSRELPSIGSMLHHKGECRPCTFFHTRGCENKEDCQFCHLCGPSEKKKRLRALKRAQREAELAALGAGEDTPAGWSPSEANMDTDMVVE